MVSRFWGEYIICYVCQMSTRDAFDSVPSNVRSIKEIRKFINCLIDNNNNWEIVTSNFNICYSLTTYIFIRSSSFQLILYLHFKITGFFFKVREIGNYLAISHPLKMKYFSFEVYCRVIYNECKIKGISLFISKKMMLRKL
jgi:hypothetical protein